VNAPIHASQDWLAVFINAGLGEAQSTWKSRQKKNQEGAEKPKIIGSFGQFFGNKCLERAGLRRSKVGKYNTITRGKQRITAGKSMKYSGYPHKLQ